MDWVRKWATQIQAHLSDLSVSQKLLIATLGVVVMASVFVVALYAGRPQMAPVIDQSLSSSEQARITAYLDSRRIRYKVEGDRVMIPAERQAEVLAGLQLQQLLPEDTSQGFATLIETQTWWQSSAQNHQMYMIALQNELSAIVRKMRSVHDAKVIISEPRDTGFGATHKQPSASVNVQMATGAMNEKLADAMAGLVAGAVAELTPENVTVIDAEAGRQFRKRDNKQLVPSDFLELVQIQERSFRERIASALSYIPKVIVAVNVEVDPSRKQTESTIYDQDQSVSLIERERTREESSTERRDSGEPGPRANTAVNIPGSGGAGSRTSVSETESEFEPHAGVTREQVVDPGGVPTRVNATVNVPRSYFVSLYMQGKADDTEPPDDQDLQPIYNEHLDRIKRQVEPLLMAKSPGNVVVDVYPDGEDEPGDAAVATAGGGAGGLLSGGHIRTVALSALGLVALVAMFMMIRKASQPPPQPDSSELAGLPPSFGGEDVDVAGEAGEFDAALPGMELDDEQIASRKVTEQVAEMIRNNPAEAASAMRQWVTQDD
jgi:flagellar M-ring protein FliF